MAGQARDWRSFLRTKAWAVLFSIFILVLLQWMEYSGWLGFLNGPITDAIVGLRSRHSESTAPEVYVIGIDDDAYSTIFDGRSPMYPDRVSALVKTVADANPKVIGVDILTEGQEYRTQIADFTKFPSLIVWISSFRASGHGVPQFQSWLFGARDRRTFSPSAVLGMSPFELPQLRQTNWGIPMFARDEDFRIRRLFPYVSLTPDEVQGGGYIPSWAKRVADVYCGGECYSEPADQVYFSYSTGWPKQYRVSDLFRYDAARKAFQSKDLTWPTLKPALLGKLVLIGGTFRESGDFHETARNQLPGLVINAFAVKTELGGTGLVQVSQPLAWILDLLLALVIIWVCDKNVLTRLDRYPFPSVLRGWKRKKMALGTLIVICFCVGSFFVAHGRYLLGFAGEGIGVMIDRMRDLWEFSEEERKEAEQLKSEAKAV